MIKFRRPTPLFIILVFAALLVACTKESRDALLEGFTDGIVLNVNTDIFRVPLSLQFVNANIDASNSPDKINLTIDGPGKNLVYSTDGSKKLEVVNGLLEVAVDKALIINKNNPIELRFSVESNGFLTTVQSVKLIDTSLRVIPVKMVEIKNLPDGVDVEETTFNSSKDGLSDNVVIETTGEEVGEEEISASLESGTKVLDENKKELSGQVKVQLAHFDNTSDESLSAFPGGLIANSVVDKKGNDLGKTQFLTAGFISFDMYVNNSEVKNFTKPVEMSMGIDKDLVNPETKQKIKAGDKVPVWSLDENTGKWMYEGEAEVVESTDGKLEGKFEITHLSWWNLAFANNQVCEEAAPVTFSIISNFSDACSAPVYYGRFYDPQTMTYVGNGDYFSLLNGTSVNIYDLPFNKAYRMDFFNLEGQVCGIPVTSVDIPVISCNSTYNVDLSLLNLSLFKIEATMSGKCSGDGSDLIVRPDFVVYFRPTGCSTWNYLGKASKGFFCSSNLENGGTYDFSTSYGAENYVFDAVTLESQTINFNNSILEIVIDNNSNSASLIFSEILLPDDFCDELLGG